MITGQLSFDLEEKLDLWDFDNWDCSWDSYWDKRKS